MTSLTSTGLVRSLEEVLSSSQINGGLRPFSPALDSLAMDAPLLKRSNRTDSTIDQVAKLAGVSRATVSRVMNGSAHVSPERVKAVQRAIKELNFTPNSTARRLAGGKSGLIALLIEESSEEFFTNSFWGEVVKGFSETIREAGMHPLMLIQPKSGTEESLFATLQAGQMDGLAIFGWHKPVKVLEKLLDPKMAVVFGGDFGGSKKYPCVDVDNVRGGYLATQHLIESGCTKILVITGDLTLQSARDRLSGYEKAISEAGLKIDEKLIVHGDYTQIKAESIVRQVLRSKRKFDGIFAANDLSAVGAIEMLLQHGVSVPEQVKVIGFDDSPVATNGVLPVTSIRQPIKELGIEVALSLLEILNGGQVGDKLLGVKLIKRKSTAR